MRNKWHDRGDHFAVELWWADWPIHNLGRRLQLHALVDLAGLRKMQAISGTWHAMPDKSGQTYYARITVKGQISRRDIIYLHRLVTDCPDGLEPDHLNYNGLDCRPYNLKIGTHRDNIATRRRARGLPPPKPPKLRLGPRESVVRTLPRMTKAEARAYVLKRIWG